MRIAASTRLLVILAGLVIPVSLGAETLVLEPTQDNTLYESPSGRLSNGSGDHLFVGATNALEKRRTVIAFKDLQSIPAGATIASVRLRLFLSRESTGPEAILVHRLTADWGEGASDALENEGGGANSADGDATWVHRFSPNIVWSDPGGDFETDPSAFLLVDAPGPYTVIETDGLIADVQHWVDNPDENFGWILIGDEIERSAKRFDSREFGESLRRPQLVIEFTTTGTPYDFSGLWYDPELDGEGYNILQTPAGWLIYFFGYTADGTYRWLTSDLVKLETLTLGEPFDLPMLVGTPGTFDMPTPGSELEPYGTLSATFIDCLSAVFVLDGLDGLKTSELIKLVGVDRSDCVDPESDPDP